MKGYTVFNVEQIEGLPEHYYGKPQARTESVQRTTTALIACRGTTRFSFRARSTRLQPVTSAF
jgi:antirestriction protein ArdC